MSALKLPDTKDKAAVAEWLYAEICLDALKTGVSREEAKVSTAMALLKAEPENAELVELLDRLFEPGFSKKAKQAADILDQIIAGIELSQIPNDVGRILCTGYPMLAAASKKGT